MYLRCDIILVGVIFQYNNFYFRSPLSGIINYESSNDQKYLVLKIIGRNQIFNYKIQKKNDISGQFHKESGDLKSMILEKINHNGVFSFEYHQPLSDVLSKNKKIVFLLTDNLIPDFWKEIWIYLKKEIENLDSILKNNFAFQSVDFSPNLRSFFKQSFIEETKLFRYEYIRYLFQLKDRDIIVLTPVTLLALIYAIYYDEPFTKSVVVFKDYSTKQFFYSFLYHGTNLGDIIEKQNTNSKIDDLLIYNIYENYIFHFKEKISNSVCTLCFQCNHYCPVNASPVSLFDNQGSFLKEKCIECGICDEICESNLDIRSLIKQEKMKLVQNEI